MAGYYVNELHQPYFAGCHSILVNSNDGFYLCGKLYRMETGVRVHNEVFTTINKGNINGEDSDDTDN
jgi:hypothetical protein